MTDPTPETVPEPIQSFIDATNNADSAAFVDAFTADATLNDWGRIVHGHDGVASWNQTDNIGKHSHFSLVSIRPGNSADEFVAILDVSGDGYNGLSTFAFTINGSRIRSLVLSA